MPLEGTLDTHVLTLFGRIMKGNSSLLYNMSLRQLALKDFTSKSWFIQLVRLCRKYELALPHRLIDGSITPQYWNSLVKISLLILVQNYVSRCINQIYLAVHQYRFPALPGKVHTVEVRVYSNTRDTVGARPSFWRDHIQWFLFNPAMFNPANWGFDTQSAKTDLSSLSITVCSDKLSFRLRQCSVVTKVCFIIERCLFIPTIAKFSKYSTPSCRKLVDESHTARDTVAHIIKHTTNGGFVLTRP